MGNCSCRSGSCIIPILLGIVAGVLALFLGEVGVIADLALLGIGIALLVLIIFAVAALADGIIRRERHHENGCMCRNATCVLIGAFGTLVTSIIAIVTGLETVALLFFLVGFFTWLGAAVLIALLCLANENCD